MKQISPPSLDNLRLSMAYRPIETVQPNPRDARVYGSTERRRIAKAVEKFGVMPMFVTQQNVLLSGNVWLEAAHAVGFREVPVIVADHLSPAEAEAFMLAQVRLVERGEWDEQKLGELLRDLTVQGLDLDVTLTGFDVAEIDLKIAALDGLSDAPDPADEPAPAGPSVTRARDLWVLGGHRLYCGNSLERASYEALMGDERANIGVTDAPFNVPIAGHVSGQGAVVHREFAMASGEMTEAQFTAFLVSGLSFMAEFSVPGSLHYAAMDWRHMHEMIVAGRKAFDELVNLCVWQKHNAGMGSLYRSQHELFFVFKHGREAHRNNVQLGRYGRSRTNCWSYPGANTFGRSSDEGNLLHLHPTVKPVALIADILLDASARGDIVLDPFMGSGSTIIADEKVGRRARGIELDPLYVDAAVRRWERWTGEAARLEGDGRTFAEVAAERSGETSDGE